MAKGGNIYIAMPKGVAMTSNLWSQLSVAERKTVIRGLKKEEVKVSIFKRIFGRK